MEMIDPAPQSGFVPPDATIVVPVVDSSHVGEARRAAAALSVNLKFNTIRAGELAIIVTELANNLVRHAGGGELLLRPIAPNGGSGGGMGKAPDAGAGVEVLSLDRGRGIADVHAALRDGYSTAGTPGVGLGAVRRLAATFDVVSHVGRGTAIVARVWPGEMSKQGRFEVGVACVPVRGETVCGDAWCLIERKGTTYVIVADGLGHGPSAAQASQRAIETFRENADRSPRLIVEQLHAALRASRGAAVAVVTIDSAANRLRFCGVGNITAAVIPPSGVSKSLVSHNGTVGVEARRILEIEQPWIASSLLILASDGLTSRWQLSDYPGLLPKHTALIAGLLFRDHLRGRDDATVLALRDGGLAGA